MTRASKYVAPASGIQFEPQSGVRESLGGSELGNLESVACGSRPRRAYPPQWSCGREAEGGGLLNLLELSRSIPATPIRSIPVGFLRPLPAFAYCLIPVDTWRSGGNRSGKNCFGG